MVFTLWETKIIHGILLSTAVNYMTGSFVWKYLILCRRYFKLTKYSYFRLLKNRKMFKNRNKPYCASTTENFVLILSLLNSTSCHIR